MPAPRTAPATTRGAIVIDDVVKIYDPDGAAVMAVDHCSLDIEAGEICMIVGPSGCGKTTLLNAIAGFHEITSGRILLDGEVLCSADKPKAEPSSDRIVVFQNGALFPWKTNLENVAFGPLMQGKLSKAEANEKARGMMADAGLAGVEHNFPGRSVLRHAPARRDRARADERAQGAAARRALPRARLAHQIGDARGAARDLLQEQGHDLLHHPRSRRGDLPRPQGGDHDDAPVQAEEDPDVDIPHPRDYSVLTSKRFRELMEETNEAVHEEALKAFAAGEKEG